jgi:hypothetical protein
MDIKLNKFLAPRKRNTQGGHKPRPLAIPLTMLAVFLRVRFDKIRDYANTYVFGVLLARS